jgi:hypothetical protein
MYNLKGHNFYLTSFSYDGYLAHNKNYIWIHVFCVTMCLCLQKTVHKSQLIMLNNKELI